MSKYYFEGKIIRLNAKDYNSWYDSFCYYLSEPEYLRTLTEIDDYLASNILDRTSKKMNWFMMVSKILEKNRNNFLKNTH